MTTPRPKKNTAATILFVDSDWEDFAHLAELTNEMDLMLIWSRNAEEAIHCLETREVDILISSYEIRDEHGQRLSHLVKTHDDWNQIYTFLLGTEEDMVDVVRALRRGADDVMIKPLNKDIFLARIEVALRIRKTQEERLALEHEQGIMQTITTVAHEINNPLFAVLGHIDLLFDELKDELDKEGNEFIRECLETINNQGERMAEVVRKLQSMTKPRTKNYVGDQQMIDISTPSHLDEEVSDFDLLNEKE